MSKQIDEMLKKAFSGDGASWGVSSFYERAEKALIEAIRSGEDFDTGWYGVKKEIQTGRVSRRGDTITCEASVSNDFDENGRGASTFALPETPMHPERVLSMIRQYLESALDEASKDQDDNKQVEGFTIQKNGKWADEFIAPTGEGFIGEEFGPPGDYYHKWGFQSEPAEGEEEDWEEPEEKDRIPDEAKKIISDFCYLGETSGKKSGTDEDGRLFLQFRFKGDVYRVTAWDKAE